MHTQTLETPLYLDDLELVQRCVARAPGAFVELVERAEPVVLHAILATLRRCGQRPEDFDVEDMQADVVAALVQRDFARLRRYGGRCSLGHWLKVVASNATIDRLRRQRATVSLDDEAPEATRAVRSLESRAPGPEQVASSRQELARLEAALATLPEDDQRFVELHYLQGLALAEVAALMGTSVDAIYARSSRLRQRLRRAMG